jgi:hypothetical protein
MGLGPWFIELEFAVTVLAQKATHARKCRRLFLGHWKRRVIAAGDQLIEHTKILSGEQNPRETAAPRPFVRLSQATGQTLEVPNGKPEFRGLRLRRGPKAKLSTERA